MTRNDIKKAAEKLVGKPYVWGGESMSEGGFDCSGFVFKVLNDAGKKVPRTTAQGYHNYFSEYPILNNLQVQCGDLLFFGKNEKSITHVAIAKDMNTMWESIGTSKNTRKNPGKGVVVSPINRRSDLIVRRGILNDYTPFYPIYVGKSNKIDEVFATIGAPYGNVGKRRVVAAANDILQYKGTLTQNIYLIKLAKKGELKRA